MKKSMYVLLAGILCLASVSLSAKDYYGSDYPPRPAIPRMPASYPITITVDEVTGEASMFFSYAIDDLTISLVKNGVTQDSLELSVVQGETVEYQLENYDAGEYTLVFETSEGIIRTYYVTIVD